MERRQTNKKTNVSKKVSCWKGNDFCTSQSIDFEEIGGIIYPKKLRTAIHVY